MINVSDISDSSGEVFYPSDTSNIDNYGTPLASVIVSNDLEGDMEDFPPSDVLQQASAAVPDQVNPGQYFNDDQQTVSIVLDNPPFRSEAVNKFLGSQQPFNQVFFFRWWSYVPEIIALIERLIWFYLDGCVCDISQDMIRFPLQAAINNI